MKFLMFALSLLSCAIASAAEVNQPAPACPAKLLNASGQPGEQTIAPADLKGKVVLIDFWATWCGPCQKSMPYFNALHQQLASKGLVIQAINVDEQSQTALDFLQQHPVHYPIALDPDGACPNTYQVKAMPSSYLVDKSGKIRFVHLGFRDEDEKSLREQIEILLQEP
jgi:thiol-disulfide isomerase/thioredoxin